MAIDKVRAFFEGTQLEGKILEAEESSATVELAAQAFHTEPDRIAKSLSFLLEDRPILVIASGMSRVDNKKYKEQGLEILDFPCNQFGNQAPGTDEEIQEFCTLKYHTTFPQFKKIEVNGENEEPLYKFLKSEKGGIFGEKIKWNFTKFLVDREGNVVERFAPTVTPEKMDEKIKEVIEK